MDRPELYFIALVPPPDLREKVKSLKEEMRDSFNASHALKSPAHITLQMPFKRSKEDEPQIISVLKQFASRQAPFRIELCGYGSFQPRVIFIRVIDPDPIISLHKELKKDLADNLRFEPGELTKEMQPHMTIATRDLEKEMFRRAWMLFEEREFEGSFEAGSIFLLKHNGKQWDIFRELNFG